MNKIIFGLLLFVTISSFAQNVGIGTNTPNSSAKLDITSTNSGLLVPRVSLSSTTDIATIASPATSLLVYNTNAAITGGDGVGFYYYNGTQWMKLSTGVTSEDWSLTGNTGTNPASNFVGTSDNVDLVFKSNNTERIRLLNDGQIDITGDLINQEMVGTHLNPTTVWTYPPITFNGQNVTYTQINAGTQIYGATSITISDGSGVQNSAVFVSGNFIVESHLQNGSYDPKVTIELQRSTVSNFTTYTVLDKATVSISYTNFITVPFSYVDANLSTGTYYYRYFLTSTDATSGDVNIDDIDLNILQLKR